MISVQLNAEVKNTLTKIAKARPNSQYVHSRQPTHEEVDEFITQATSIRIDQLKKSNYKT